MCQTYGRQTSNTYLKLMSKTNGNNMRKNTQKRTDTCETNMDNCEPARTCVQQIMDVCENVRKYIQAKKKYK